MELPGRTSWNCPSSTIFHWTSICDNIAINFSCLPPPSRPPKWQQPIDTSISTVLSICSQWAFPSFNCTDRQLPALLWTHLSLCGISAVVQFQEQFSMPPAQIPNVILLDLAEEFIWRRMADAEETQQ